MARKIAIALSGGMDSTIAAWRLKQAGHQVVGLFMHLYTEDQALVRKNVPDQSCAPAAATQGCALAQQAAHRLGIPLEILDFRQAFEQRVIQPFVQDFISGLTPNPCTLCNREMKFGLLADAARAMGAEALATGHYVGLTDHQGQRQLQRGQDRKKDQSYFLSLVPKTQLPYLVFPLAQASKTEVLETINNLPGFGVAPKTSVEICFLGPRSYATFLCQRRPEAFQAGDIVDLNGRVLGQHQGLPYYTIGQRRGIGVAARYPLYVIRLEVKQNQVVVGPEQALWQRALHLAEVNWFQDLPAASLKVKAQVRYRQTPVWAFLEKWPQQMARLVFEKPVRAITPGQIAAVYLQDVLVAGGRIVGVETNHASA